MPKRVTVAETMGHMRITIRWCDWSLTAIFGSLIAVAVFAVIGGMAASSIGLLPSEEESVSLGGFVFCSFLELLLVYGIAVYCDCPTVPWRLPPQM